MLPRKLAIGLRTLLVASIVSVALAQPCEQWTASENEEWRTLHYDYGVDQSARKTVLQPLLDQPLADILHIEDKQLCDAQQLLGLENLEGRWYRVADSDVVYEPASCRLRRLSAGAARQCLEGKFVAFIGDSVTRYQYLSFAYFLAHMRHLPRYHGLEKPHLNDVRDWKQGWNQFMLEGSQQIMDEAAPGASVHESCDCWRVESSETVNGKGFREFRRLCITQQGLPDGRACANTTSLPSATLKLGYQQAMGHPTWYEAPLEALSTLLQEHPRPDVVVLNAGLWAPHGQYVEEHGATLALQQYRILLGNASAMAAEHGVKLIWKSTTTYDTMTKHSKVLHAAASQAAAELNLPVYDVHSFGNNAIRDGFAQSLYFDKSLHYWSFAYQELNDVLLNVLCDQQCAWAGAR